MKASRRAQLVTLLREAVRAGDADKVTELLADLWYEFGLVFPVSR